jgi:large subunit ribosomal protein L4
MKYPVYNIKGEETKTVELDKEIFEVKISPDLIHQAILIQKNNRRQGTVQTKDRGAVRGGGRKPWKQKGTGRARVGSIRSPLWIGGGVTFGPEKKRNYKGTLPKKMRQKALFMVLSAKAKDKSIILLDNLSLEKIKTKELSDIINNLPVENKSCLIILPDKEDKLVLSARNIPMLKVIEARNLNSLDMVNFRYLIIPQASLKVIKDVFLKK